MKILSIILFLFHLLIAQNVDLEVISPCDDPLIKLASNKGIKAVPVKNILKYKRLLKACEKEGRVEDVKQILAKDWHRDFQRSKVMASWTSTHAMCVFVSFAYYFAGKILAVKPESS